MNAWFDGPVGHGRKVLLLIAAGACCALLFAAYDFWDVSRTRGNFVLTPCYMELSTMTKEPGRTDRNLPGWNYVPTVQYKYTVGGQDYTSTTICSRTTVINSETAASTFMKDFGPGADANCYVNPNDPQDSMLVLPTSAQAMKFFKIGGFAFGIAAIGLIALQVMISIDTRPKPRRYARAPGWGEIDSGDGDLLRRTRGILKDKLES